MRYLCSLAVVLLAVCASGCTLGTSGSLHTAAMLQTRDLNPVDDALLKSTLDSMMAAPYGYAVFQIHKGELYYRANRHAVGFRMQKVLCFVNGLLLNEDNGIPDTVFALNMADGSMQHEWNPLTKGPELSGDYTETIGKTMPVFSFARDRLMRNSQHFPLFPDDYSIGSGDMDDFYMAGLGVGMKQIADVDTKPYREKKKAMMWRGKNTGPHCHKAEDKIWYSEECLYTPKIAAVNLSKVHSFLDCKFAAPKGVTNVVDRHFGTTERDIIDMKGKADYQKLLVIDGIRSTFPGFAYTLMYNSVTLKVEGTSVRARPQHVFEQWFHSQLVPYRHFYPIDSTSMNESLHKAYAYLEAYPGVAEEIAQRGQRFARDMLTPCAMERYTVLLLRNWEEKVRVGDRPLLEGMQRLTDADKGYCNARHSNFVKNKLWEAHGTISVLERKAKTKPLEPRPQPKPEPLPQKIVVLPAKMSGSSPATLMMFCVAGIVIGILTQRLKRGGQ